MDFNDLKKSITSSNWIKIGSKFNSPALSIFPEEIKQELITQEYQLNKIYYFDDNTHEYKIQCLPEDGKKIFIIFAKSKNPIIEVPVEKPKQKYDISFNNNQKMLILAVAIVLVGLILLSGPILRAFGM